MIRKVTILGIAAVMMMHPVNAQAGLFGGHKSYSDEGDSGSYQRPAEHGDDLYGGRSNRGSGREEMRVREVPRRSKSLAEIATQHERDEERPRSARRLDESAADDAHEGEQTKFDRKMQDLHRQLEEAEQAENPRKIKAVKWMIQKEEERHEKALASATRAPRTARRATGPSYEQPEQEADQDRDRFERPAPRRREADEEAPPRRHRGLDEERPPQRTAARHEDDDVNNPLRERSRRAGREQDPESRYHRRSDRDEDEQDRDYERPRKKSLGSNAARVERAEGSIRRY